MADKTKVQPITKGRSSKRLDWNAILGKKTLERVGGWLRIDRLRWIILVFLSLIISVLLFPNILSKPTLYKLGDVAKRDIKASRDFLIENKELTDKDKDKAAREVLAVYDFDSSALNLISPLREAFQLGRENFAAPSDSSDPEREKAPSDAKPSPEGSDNYNAIKDRFFSILDLPPDNRLFAQLVKQGFPSQLEETIIRLIAEVSEIGVVGNMAMLKNQIEKGGVVLHEIYTKKQTTVVKFDRFHDVPSAARLIGTQTKALRATIKPSELAQVSIKLAQSLIKPNLTFNQRETEQRKEAARESAKPVYFKVKKGEMLVREGERIGSEHLLKLSGETRSLSRIDMIGRVPAMAVLMGVLFVVVYLVGLGRPKALTQDTRDLLFTALTVLSIFIFIWAYSFVAEEVARGYPYFSSTALLFAMPVAFGAMLISIIQGRAMAVAFSLVISVLASLITGGRVEFFIYFFINSLVAAYGVRNCTERGILIKTGLMVGLINIVLSLAVGMIYGSLYTLESVVAAVSGFTGGLLAGVIATGILPLVEMSFGFTTDIKLLELGNLDQPLLRDLMVQAPGTYHHCVIISNMVEAAAKAVQANPLLAKVSAYYHDIGKMKKPLYFIENQMGGENRHEKLAPSMSSLILISHVKDGVELAKEHKMGREIIDIIQQHHGSSVISYFYQKAKDRMVAKGGKAGDIKEEDFRYPGPKPQTKEAGLVMLADMSEAASRSLVDPTPSRIQGMVQKIVNKVFSDGQLDECELTLKDLHEIAKSFNKTLGGIFHHRIEYPEAATKGQRRSKNGNSDQGATEDSGAKKQEDKAELADGLKRLGLS
ncbi:MAG: HDIG domain-containing protein [Desulfobacterales bacterium]|nr:HDIG domain-containing protein [Desulfobacterales bacterium]